MAYITPATDVSDVDVRQIITALTATSDSRLTLWSGDVDAELVSMAYGFGLDDDSITTPVNAIVKRYLVAYYCYIVFRDIMGASNTDDMAREKYKQKFEIYANECMRLRGAVTKNMIYYGNADDSIDEYDRVKVNFFVRG